MGVAYYVVLDQDDADVVLADGKAVARHEDRLDELAADADMPHLMTFFGMDGEDVSDLLDMDDVPDSDAWHDANDGAMYFDRLVELATAAGDLPDDVIGELRQFAAILRTAAAQGARWQLAVDI